MPATKRFEFHELQIMEAAPLSPPFFDSCGPHPQALGLDVSGMPEPGKRQSSPSEYGVKHMLIPVTLTDDLQAFQTLLEACHALQVLDGS